MKAKTITAKENIDGVRGYKVFNPNWTCCPDKNPKQYTCPGTFEEDGILELCKHGMHFCQKIEDCFCYYDFNSKNHVAEVIAYGEVVTKGNKSCTNKLAIIRELSWEEVLELANSGENNTGCGNSGDGNIGHNNLGNCNIGDSNVGNRNTGVGNKGDDNTGRKNLGSFNVGGNNIGICNTGDENEGDYNTGFCNEGIRNSGDFNIGAFNTGCFNKSNYNTGCFNTEPETIRMFNKPSDWTYEDWLYSDAHTVLMNMPRRRTAQWIYLSDIETMPEEQKTIYSGYEVTKGCLVPRQDYDRQAWWGSKLADYERECIKALPNFDAVIFFKCTGIVA